MSLKPTDSNSRKCSKCFSGENQTDKNLEKVLRGIADIVHRNELVPLA